MVERMSSSKLHKRSSKGIRKALRLLLAITLATGFIAACTFTTNSEEGGETHFLRACTNNAECVAINPEMRCRGGFCSEPEASQSDAATSNSVGTLGDASPSEAVIPSDAQITSEPPLTDASATETTACEGASDNVKPRYFPEPPGGIPPFGYWDGEHVQCPEFGGGWGWNSYPCLDATQCDVACETALDCPDPGSGDALRECDVNRGCFLRCDDGQTCPDGMQCVPRPVSNVPVDEQERWCMWVAQGEDEIFECWAENHPESCAEFTTKGACEARIDASPLVLSRGCIWVSETIVSTSDDTCEATTRERCVEGVSCNEDRCGVGTTARCGGCGPLIYFAELADGRTSLVTTDFKGYAPADDSGPNRNWHQCEYDADATTPAVCDCACSDEVNTPMDDGG